MAYVAADVYMHNPRGSNNRYMRNRANDPNNRQNSNANRLFDSQNNQNGGYDWGAEPMQYYEGSQLSLEWTMQHGCGIGGKTHCDIIWQYTCGKDVRDGASTNTIPATQSQSLDVSYGMHESFQYWSMCNMRYRNMGLFTADQELQGDRATYTRQNPNGNDRHGFECTEERDYYPYWQWSPWVDIVILTTQPDRCAYYQAESQNVKARGYCTKVGEPQNMMPWQFIDQSSCVANGWDWVVDNTVNGAASATDYPNSKAWNLPAPDCIEAPWTRDNNLGNARMGTLGGQYYSGIDNPAYNWTIPTIAQIASIFSDPTFGGASAAQNCVLRLRYNTTTMDYDGWATDAASNGPMYSEVVNDPWADYGWSYLLRLAVDTTQFGRTFQDRSHTFSIIPRPTTVTSWARAGGVPQNGQVKRQGVSPYTWTSSAYNMQSTDRIFNLNVNGRRGNYVQAYPAEGYGFRPRIVRMRAGDFLHPQWTGSNAGTVDAVGEGATSTDAHSLVQIEDLLHNWPVNYTTEQNMFEPSIAFDLAFSGIYNSDGSENTPRLQPTLNTHVCLTRAELEDLFGNMGTTSYEAIRHSPYNCAKLSGLLYPHYNAGLIRMNNPGIYYAMDGRNNKPGFQTVKVTIVVEP